MSALNETASEMMKRLCDNAKSPKSVKSLGNVRKACDAIELMHGEINPTRVGLYTEEYFGTPKQGSIHNSNDLKHYIIKRKDEYIGKSNTGVNTRSSKYKKQSIEKYPVDNLDTKTRVYIKSLRDELKRTTSENQYLSNLLKEETRKNPPSLADGIFNGATDEGSLEVKIEREYIPDFLINFIKTVLGKNYDLGEVKQLEIQKRENRVSLVCTDFGIVKTVLSPREWNELSLWFDKRV